VEILRILPTFYWNPRRAASQTLDHASLLSVAVLAILVALLLRAPQYVNEGRIATSAAHEVKQDAKQEEGKQQGRPFQMASPLSELLIVAGLAVPAGIALLTLWKGHGSLSVALQQEFGAMFLCAGMTWAATHLPLVILGFTPWYVPWAPWVALVWWVILMAVCWSTSMGAMWPQAVTAATLGGGLVAAGGFLTGILSPVLYFAASPWILIFLWGTFSSGASAVGASVSGRQSLKRALEATTINPRDADAHYQLALLQMKRRNFEEAEARLRTAVEIDPEDADYLLNLGAVVRERGRNEEALKYLERAAKINPKVSSYQVWCEMGAAYLALGDTANALPALERYVGQREYDPVGLVRFGEALEAGGRKDEAREMYTRAIEAARTMPAYRRSEMRPWAAKAKSRLGAL
jgi:tetratricopeptide (TPR) repeat protein